MHPIMFGKPHDKIIMSEKSITFCKEATEPNTIQPKYTL